MKPAGALTRDLSPRYQPSCEWQLWYAYLKERHEAVRGLRITSPAHAALNNTFERALVTMHKMPKIWELYLGFLVEQKVLTRARRAFDRALSSLAVTQHERIWTIYLVRGRRSSSPPRKV